MSSMIVVVQSREGHRAYRLRWILDRPLEVFHYSTYRGLIYRAKTPIQYGISLFANIPNHEPANPFV